MKELQDLLQDNTEGDFTSEHTVIRNALLSLENIRFNKLTHKSCQQKYPW